jgi:CHAD domain-containing protein
LELVDVAAPATSTHETRKAIKRIRALLRLVRSTLPKPAFRRYDTVLRSVARAVSPIRDAWVAAGLLDELAAAAGPDAASAARQCRERFDDAVAGFLSHPARAVQLRSDLGGVATAATAWFDGTYRGGTPISHEFAAVAPGLDRVYRSSRAAWNDARISPTVASRHRLRRVAKYLRHLVETLHVIDPESMDGLEARLVSLTDALGDDHDLALLETWLGDEAAPLPARRALLAAVAPRRRDLVAEAMELGRGVFTPTPRDFLDTIQQRWPSRPTF